MNTPRKGKRRLFRWLLRCCVLLLFIAGGAVGAFATGKPQEFAVEWAAEALAGVTVDAHGVQLFERVRVESLMVYPDKNALRGNKPFAAFEMIEISLDLEAVRRIPRVSIESLYLHPSTQDDSENLTFVQELLASDDSETDVTWLPERLHIDKLWVTYLDEELSASVRGVQFDAEIDDAADIDARIHGTAAEGLFVEMTTPETNRLSLLQSPKVDLEIGITADAVVAKGFIDQSGDLHARLDASVDLSGDSVLLRVSEFIVDGHRNGWEALGLFPIQEFHGSVETFALEIRDAEWTLDGSAYPTATVSASVRDMELNDSVGPLFSGAISLADTQITGGDTLTVQGQLSVNDELVSLLEAFQSSDEQRVSATFENWSKTAMVAATPADFRGWFEDLAFDTLAGTIRYALRGEEFALMSDVNSTSSRGDSPVGLQVSLNGTRGKVSGTTGELVLSLGEGSARGKGVLTADGDYEGTLAIESMPLRPFALLAMGARLPEHISGQIDGEVSLLQAAKSVEAVVRPQVKLTELVFNEKSQPDVGLSGEILVDTETRIAKSEALTLGTPNDELGIVMNEAVYAIDSREFSGRMELFVDLGWFDSISEAGGLFGTSNTLGTVTGSEGVWRIAFMGTSDDVGYGDLLLPYGSEMTAEGLLRVTEESLLTEFVDTTIRIGEGSRMTIPMATYIDEAFSGTATLESDLQILVDMAYVEAVEGAVSGETSWTLKQDAHVDWTTNGVIESLTLPEGAGEASGVQLAMSGNYTDAFSGDGTFSAIAISASGATIHETSGSLGFEENVLVLSDGKSRLFEGALKSRVGIGILEEGIPIRYDGSFERINLTRLTEEVQPPKTKLTGFGRGTLEADYSLGSGLEGFELHAESAGFFSLNRSLVEEMMQMQSALKGLGESQLKKTLGKYLGEAPQRPFDSAAMDLFLSEGAIEGVAELKSEKTAKYNGLNLTVQLSIDKPALAESLRMLQNSGEE